MNINYKDFINNLSADYINNLVALKHATLFKNNAEYFIDDRLNYYSISFPASQSLNDKKIYHDHLIHLTNIRNTEQLNKYLINFSKKIHIIKTGYEIIDKNLKLLQHLWSYTRKDLLIHDKEDIEIGKIFSDSHTQLLNNVNYSVDEANELISNNGFSVTLIKNKILVSCCFAFQNFEDIWEIGGVSTLPINQKNGYAEKVVRFAINKIIENGNKPRYNVNIINKASIRLAEKCGLSIFLNTYHYEYKS